jgi:hypothetical protein
LFLPGRRANACDEIRSCLCAWIVHECFYYGQR